MYIDKKIIHQTIYLKMNLKSNEVNIYTPLEMLHFHTTQLSTGN